MRLPATLISDGRTLEIQGVTLDDTQLDPQTDFQTAAPWVLDPSFGVACVRPADAVREFALRASQRFCTPVRAQELQDRLSATGFPELHKLEKGLEVQSAEDALAILAALIQAESAWLSAVTSRTDTDSGSQIDS